MSVVQDQSKRFIYFFVFILYEVWSGWSKRRNDCCCKINPTTKGYTDYFDHLWCASYTQTVFANESFFGVLQNEEQVGHKGTLFQPWLFQDWPSGAFDKMCHARQFLKPIQNFISRLKPVHVSLLIKIIMKNEYYLHAASTSIVRNNEDLYSSSNPNSDF